MIRFAAYAVCATLSGAVLATATPALSQDVVDSNGNLAALISRHAAANNIPESLVRRVVMRESRGNARAISKGNYGIMQIRLGTARGLGYTGTAAGLLDADTNMTYAVKYLAGAYRVAGGNESRAVSYYAAGYYYAAKRQGIDAAAPKSAALVAYASAEPTVGVVPSIAPENSHP
ncbi:MAG: lytic transglycosylase domain-containing protein [Pseudolabrys sp.]|nr:lytic transglycosylase domain-containing protein [Pseudolabrys sp.]